MVSLASALSHPRAVNASRTDVTTDPRPAGAPAFGLTQRVAVDDKFGIATYPATLPPVKGGHIPDTPNGYFTAREFDFLRRLGINPTPIALSMSKSYQIVEPPTLAGLFGAPTNFTIAVALFTWLIHLLREDLKEELVGAELEVIRAEYQEAYPAIGIHYLGDTSPDDLGPLVESMIARLLSERTLTDFLAFVARSKIDWKEVTDNLVRTPSAAP